MEKTQNNDIDIIKVLDSKIISGNEVKDAQKMTMESVIIRESYKYPLLSFEEELELGKRVKEYNDERAVQKLVLHNLRLVIDASKSYRNRKLSNEDVLQNGIEGLTKAALRYDYTKGFRFSTYAMHWIRQNITREFENTADTIRIPTSAYAKLYKFESTRQQLLEKDGYEVSDEEVKKELNMSDIEYKNLLLTKREMISLNQNINSEGKDSPLDKFIEDEKSNVEENVMDNSFYEEIYTVFDVLTDIEKQVIVLHFGLLGNREHTFQEIGDILGKTRQRVQQIEAKAFEKISTNKKTRNLKEYIR